MTFLKAAEEVLRSEGRPLSTRELTEIALSRGLLRTSGQTPTATMAAALYRAPANGPIRRKFRQGKTRAARDSVRWEYVGSRA
ncbi:MAG: winged helix-turn-helix domain-containing protein [Solirubrobacterales bacterium]